jgi:hypothetical protein
MKPIEIIAQDLFDKVRSRFSNLQMGDDNGAVTANPPDARFFDFDFVIEGNNLGRVSISINDTGNLKIFFSQGITEDADDATQGIWYDFLKEMRFFAKRRLMRFDTRDITKDNLDKTDFQYLAQTGPKDNNMTESQMFGNSTKSSKRKVGDTLLIVRHEGAIDPTVQGARSRKIKNIFIQNAEGERFKLPMAWLPLGKALQRHVYHGGYPHDECGQDMIETAGQCHQLSNFYKHVSRKTPSMNPDALNIAEKVASKLKSLRHHMESLAGQKYYEAWKESFAPAVKGDSVLDDATMESYKDTFTVRGFDESLVDAFPLVHAIMQEAGEVDLNALVSEAHENDCTECGMPESRCECDEGSTNEDFDAFESWADSVVEGTVTPDVMIKLKELMAGDLQLGASGELISTLQGIGLDDKVAGDLFDVLEKMNPNSDSDLIKQIIISELEKVDPAASEELIAAAQGPQQPQTQPAPQLPAPEAGAEQPQEEPAMAEATPVQQQKPGGIGDVKTRKDWEKKRGQWDSKQSMESNGSEDESYEDILNAIAALYGPEIWDNDAMGDLANDLKQVNPTPQELDFITKHGKLPKRLQGMKFTNNDTVQFGEASNSGFDRETFHHWMADAAERIARGEFKDEHEVAADLQNYMMGAIDPDMADKVAHRLFGHDSIAQHRIKNNDDAFVKDVKQKTGYDSDDNYDSDVKNISNQIAKHGSFKSGDSGHLDYEDSLDPEVDPDNQLIEPDAENKKPKNASNKEIYDSIIGFLNTEPDSEGYGTWTKGRKGIIAHCSREFGKAGGKAAKTAIELLSQKYPMRDDEEDAEQHHNDIAEMRRLAGMTIIEADGTVTSTPWAKIKKNKNGKPTDPWGVVGSLAKQGKDSASKETKKK